MNHTVSQSLSILSLLMAFLGVISLTTWILIYERIRKYHNRVLAIDVLDKLLQREEISWDNFVILYMRNTDGQRPRYEDGRVILAEVKKILEEQPFSQSKGLHRGIRDAQRSVPQVTDVANREYGCNLVIACVMFMGVLATVSALNSGTVGAALVGAVMVSVPSVVFIYGAFFVIVPQLARHIRASAEREKQLTSLKQSFRGSYVPMVGIKWVPNVTIDSIEERDYNVECQSRQKLAPRESGALHIALSRVASAHGRIMLAAVTLILVLTGARYFALWGKIKILGSLLLGIITLLGFVLSVTIHIAYNDYLMKKREKQVSQAEHDDDD